jgi:Ribbon-helix-helix protein, copG family
MGKPLQVYLDPDDFERLDALAASRGWSRSQAVRVAIRALSKATGGKEDPLLELSGMIDGLPEDLSDDLHRYLDETFCVAETPARYRRPRRRAGRLRR